MRLALKRKRVLIWVSQPMYSILEQVFLFGTAWLWEYFLSSSRSQNPHHSQLIPKHLFGNYDKFTMIMMTSLEKFAMTTKTYLKKFSMMGKDLLKKFLMTFSIHYQDHHCIANYHHHQYHHHLLWHHHHHSDFVFVLSAKLYLCICLWHCLCIFVFLYFVFSSLSTTRQWAGDVRNFIRIN